MSPVVESSKVKDLLFLGNDEESSKSLVKILFGGFSLSLGSHKKRISSASAEFSDRCRSDSALSELSSSAHERNNDVGNSSWKISTRSLSRDSGHEALTLNSALSLDTDDENDENSEVNLFPLQSLAISVSHEDTLANIRCENTGKHFQDFYHLGDDHLGSGAYACVRTATLIATGAEFAAKLISKHVDGHTRERILREVEIFEHCRNHPNIIQLIEWFEDDNYFYMIFEKMHGGPLLSRIQQNVCFMEQEAGLVTKDIANALKHLHDRGIAHRDVKPENILCPNLGSISPVKLCDMDLASFKKIKQSCEACCDVEEPDFQSAVGSAEFLAPEVVTAFIGDQNMKLPGYNSSCDMWSLGVIIYIMLCGYPPFCGECDRKNCGWDQGSDCYDCQLCLFQRIQMGKFSYPEEEWGSISDEVKDLIDHLLVRDVSKRYTAEDVLNHTWLVHAAPTSNTILQTASNLSRNESQRDIQQMNELFKNCHVQESQVSFRSEGCPCTALSTFHVPASSV